MYNFYIFQEDYFNNYFITEDKNEPNWFEFDRDIVVNHLREEVCTNEPQTAYNILKKYFGFGGAYDYLFHKYGSKVANTVVQ